MAKFNDLDICFTNGDGQREKRVYGSFVDLVTGYQKEKGETDILEFIRKTENGACAIDGTDVDIVLFGLYDDPECNKHFDTMKDLLLWCWQVIQHA